ncbi:MAG: hypothetical protein LBS48_04475 [Treponema sp.]|nr:hypothetical protein [Treponema sp.]
MTTGVKSRGWLPGCDIYGTKGAMETDRYNLNKLHVALEKDLCHWTHEEYETKPYIPYASQTERSNYENKPFVPMAEKAAGIKIEWMLPADDAIPAIIASGDLPDIFWRSMSAADMVSGLFQEITDEAMQKYAPNVWDMYENHVDGWRSFLTQGEGKRYSLDGGFWTSYNHKEKDANGNGDPNDEIPCKER